MQENVEGGSSFPQTFLLSQNDIPCYYQGLSLEVYMKVIWSLRKKGTLAYLHATFDSHSFTEQFRLYRTIWYNLPFLLQDYTLNT